MESYQELEGILLPIVAVVAVTTVVVMAVTGRCAQGIIRKMENSGKDRKG